MARTLHDKQTETALLAQVEGSFPTTNGTTDAPGTKLGKGFTVTKPSSGKYKVQFDSRKYAALVDWDVHCQRPSVDNVRCILGDYVAPTATAKGYAHIYTVAEDGTPAVVDPSDNANSRVGFCFTFSTISTLD